MPYKVSQTPKCPAGKPWGCIQTQSGQVMGCFSTAEEATRQQRALYAKEGSGAMAMSDEAKAQNDQNTPGGQP